MVKDFWEWGKRGGESKGFGKGFWREEGEGRRRGGRYGKERYGNTFGGGNLSMSSKGEVNVK